MRPLHPERCPGRPDRLRWVVPAGLTISTGTPTRVPASLERLFTDGTLTAVAVEPGAVLTTLAAGHNWADDGPRIRSALHAALDDPDGWESGGTAGAGADEPLRAAAVAVLAGSAGEVARSHGGRIELVDVHDGVVTVRLTGACHGCPAAQATLRHRLDRHIRQRCPRLRAVVAATQQDGVRR